MKGSKAATNNNKFHGSEDNTFSPNFAAHETMF